MPHAASRARSRDTAFLVLAITAVVVVALATQRPPPPLPATAPAAAFSAERALAHVAAVAAEPHAIGTPENQAVRDHLIGALAALGLETEVQRATAVSERFATAGIVDNVLGRWRGRDPSGAILLVAHVDSVTTAPGAADNGAAVAAILEALRALMAGPPLRNDLLVLFSDGEEVGLLGAEAFASEHPWMEEVALVVNLEARGSGGPSVLVETSHGNAELIRAFAANVPYPNASSLAFEVYDLLPNDTDFTVFRDRGLPGFNFAFIRRAAHYHTALDALAQLEPASLQHHGEHVLALARHYGEVDLRRSGLIADSDDVYVDVLRRFVVHYPEGWALPLAIATALAWVAVVAWARRRGDARLRGVAAGSVWLLLVLGAAVGVTWAATGLLGRLQPALANPWMAASYRPEATMVGLTLVALLVVLLLAQIARRWWRPVELALGALLGWAASAIAVAMLVPGGSYLLTWPTLTLLAALAAVIGGVGAPAVAAATDGGPDATVARESVGPPTAADGTLPVAAWATTPWQRTLLVAGALPGLLWLPPFAAEGFYAVGLPLAAAVMLLVAWGATLLTPLTDALWGRRGWVPLLLLASAAASLAVGAWQAGYGVRQPRPTNAFYVVDPDRGVARFASLQPDPDDWTAAFIAPEPPGERPSLTDLQPDGWELRHGPAPVLGLPAPRLDVLEDGVVDGRRTIELRLASERPATRLTLLVHPDAPVEALTLDGRPVGRLQRPNGWTRLMVFGPMQDGVTVRFSTRADARLELVLSDETHDLLELAELAVPPRPAGTMAVQSRLSDAVLVTRRWVVAPPE
jgi:hypothetical protein